MHSRATTRESLRPAGSRPAAWLALAALLLQFVASWGHFHAEDFGGPGGNAPAISAARSLSSAPDDNGSGVPGRPDRDDCAICVTMHLAGTATLAAPLLLLDPPALDVAPLLPPLADLRIAWPRRFLFESRGPPQA